jgi:hypothetical protein
LLETATLAPSVVTPCRVAVEHRHRVSEPGGLNLPIGDCRNGSRQIWVGGDCHEPCIHHSRLLRESDAHDERATHG